MASTKIAAAASPALKRVDLELGGKSAEIESVQYAQYVRNVDDAALAAALMSDMQSLAGRSQVGGRIGLGSSRTLPESSKPASDASTCAANARRSNHTPGGA